MSEISDPLAPYVLAVPLAVKKLRAQLHCGNPRVEVMAARAILSLSNKLIERDIKRRVEALEKELLGIRPAPVRPPRFD